jgi:hypothetical protein
MKIKKPSSSVGGGNYQYLDLPESMDDCYYVLRLTEFKLSQNADKFFAVFEVLETDTKVKPGQEVSLVLDPNQQFAETYFWRDLHSVVLALRGMKVTSKRLVATAEKHTDDLLKAKAIIKYASKYVGNTCRVDIVRFEKGGKSRTARKWAPYEG